MEIVRNNISDEDSVLHVIHRNDDIESVLWNLVNVCGYYPRIDKRNLNVSSLIFTVGKLKIIISSQELDSMPNERKLIFNNEIQYDAYYNANDKFVKEYLKMEYKSMYNQEDVSLEAQYQIRPKCMSFNDVKVKTAFE